MPIPHGSTAKSAGRRTTSWVLGVTLAGLALRIVSIDTRGLWLDESLTVKQASQSLAGVVQTIAEGVHPPLFHILMHLWMTAFGQGEIAVRSFSVLVGVAAIPAAYWAGTRLYDRRTGLMAMGAVALSPYLIWYSQEARMYSMLFLAGLLSTAFLALAVREDRAHQWWGFLLWTTVGMFTHYFFAFLLVGQVAFYLFGVVVADERRLAGIGLATADFRHPWRLFADVKTLGPWLACTVVTAVAVLMWLMRSVFVVSSDNALISSVAGSGLGYGQEGARLALRFNDVAAVIVQMTAGFHAQGTMDVLVAMWPFTLTLIFLLLHLLEPGTRLTWLLLAAASGIVVLLLLGQWQGQVLASRYFAAVAAPALLLAARLVARLSRRDRLVVIVLLVAFSGAAWFDQSYNPGNVMRYDNREAMRTIVAGWRPGDVVLCEPYYLDSLATYYLPASLKAIGLPLHGSATHLRNSSDEVATDMTRIVGTSRRVWLFLSFQDITAVRTDGDTVQRWLRHNGYAVAHDDVLNKVELLRYDGALAGAPSAPSSIATSATGAAAPASAGATP